MPTLTTPARSRARTAATDEARLRLRRTDVGPGGPGDDGDPGSALLMHWLLATLGGSFLAALAGWIVVTGITVLGWLSASIGPLSAAVGLGTQLWLLAHGAGANVGVAHWTLIPLGVTLLLAMMISRFAGFAARQAAATRLYEADADELDRPAQAQIARRVVWLMSLVYVATVTVVALALGAPGQALRGFVVSAVIAALSSAWGACRGLGLRVTDGWPAWLRPVPRAIAASIAVVGLGGCAALIAALVLHADRVSTITAGLGVTALGGVVLAVLQLAFWPNAVIWAASWALGAGFTLGDGSVVAPAGTNLGLLPSIPVLGALPHEGSGSVWLLGWLAVGVAAGAVGASIIVRTRPAARFDQTSLVGGLSGVLAGIVLTGIAALSRGDLGTGRLTGLGPRLLELGVMSATLMGLSGMLAGLVWGLLRRATPQEQVSEPDDEPTELVQLDDARDGEDDEPTSLRIGAEDDEATTRLDADRDPDVDQDPDVHLDADVDPDADADPEPDAGAEVTRILGRDES